MLRDETHAGAQHFCQIVRSTDGFGSVSNILVAGCGQGHEALFIRKELAAKVTGVDAAKHWEPEATWGADIDDFDLSVGSVLDLPFSDATFDMVFYHHVIEHVSDPRGSLRELARVMRPGGLIYVGAPNRHRAVAYLGSYTATRSEKLLWNIQDYKARFKGQFRNELGAHAGFSERELRLLLSENFTDIRLLTSDYIQFKYGGRLPKPILTALCSNPIRDVAAAAVYFVAKRP